MGVSAEDPMGDHDNAGRLPLSIHHHPTPLRGAQGSMTSGSASDAQARRKTTLRVVTGGAHYGREPA
jgi:hypothetical protein